MLSTSVSTEKGTDLLLPHCYNQHGAQQQGSTVGKDNSSQGPVRVWNNPPPCHCVFLFSSASGKSQLLRRHPGVRLVHDDGGIKKHLKKVKGPVGHCGRKSCFLFLKLSRIVHLTKQLHSSRNSLSTCPASIPVPP